MNELRRRERDRVEALERRRDLLASRIHDPRYQGDPNRQKAELAATKWALRVIDACASEGLLSDLRKLGHEV